MRIILGGMFIALALAVAPTALAAEGDYEVVDVTRMTERVLDIDDGEDLSAYAADSESGELLIVPEGDYVWEEELTIEHTDWGLRGEGQVTVWLPDRWGIDQERQFLIRFRGGNCLVENIDLDSEGRAAAGYNINRNTGNFEFRNLRHRIHGSTTDADQPTTRSFSMHASQGTEVLIDGFVHHNRGSLSYRSQGCIWSSSPGNVTIRNAKITGFNDNAIYTRMEGAMLVEDSVFANNTPSSIRIGGENEVVRNCTFWMDTSRGELHELDGTVNTSGVVADSAERASDGGYVENCSFIVLQTPNATGAVRFLNDNQWLEVSDSQFLLDAPDVPAFGFNDRSMERITITNTSFHTDTDSGATVAGEIEGVYETDNICISEGLVPGPITADATDCAFDWDRAYPFPEEDDYTFPAEPR